MPYKYKVVTECSSKEHCELDVLGRQILMTTNNYQTARKECIEWAAYDDILVCVNGLGSLRWAHRAYGEVLQEGRHCPPHSDTAQYWT